MIPFTEHTIADIKRELEFIFDAHESVGLSGFMRMFTPKGQDPFRVKEEGINVWFGRQNIDSALEDLAKHYNAGTLPNSPLLLDPIIFSRGDGGKPIPTGSGIIWASALTLGIETLHADQEQRIKSLGIYTSPIFRGENKQSGLKMLAVSDKMLPRNKDGMVDGCRELYELSNINSEEYCRYYLLSGINYLTKNGSYGHESFRTIFPQNQIPEKADVANKTLNSEYLKNALTCWNAYDRHNGLFKRFGVDVENLEQNLRLYNACARDFELFDRTGPETEDAKETFEFIVPGWIPKGSIILMAATGGTGKSSLAHNLAILSAIDYEEGEAPPKWLGHELNLDAVREGICVYFSGEDGPAIINARTKLYDPQSRAKRLMFQRANFGDGVTLPQFLKRLKKMPNVPLMVIDPARKYLTGDEKDAGVVSEFFQAIEEFALEKGTAVIVVHHLEKGAKPQSAADVLDYLRGSQVFIDRPRVVIGMYRDGPYTCVGLAKCNIPPSLGMITGERVFARDAKNLSLIPIAGEKGIKADLLSEEELEALRNQND
jgi:hypothetical protein